MSEAHQVPALGYQPFDADLKTILRIAQIQLAQVKQGTRLCLGTVSEPRQVECLYALGCLGIKAVQVDDRLWCCQLKVAVLVIVLNAEGLRQLAEVTIDCQPTGVDRRENLLRRFSAAIMIKDHAPLR